MHSQWTAVARGVWLATPEYRGKQMSAPGKPQSRVPVRPSSPQSDGEYHSPMRISTSPRVPEDDDAAMRRILRRGHAMCQRGNEGVNADYVAEAVRNPDVLVWFVRDQRGKAMGFALTTKPSREAIKLDLICAERRKGEGMRLFHNVLEYATERGLALELDAINEPVARLYYRHVRRHFDQAAVYVDGDMRRVGWQEEAPRLFGVRRGKGKASPKTFPMRIVPRTAAAWEPEVDVLGPRTTTSRTKRPL